MSETFEIVCGGCRALVPSDAELCPYCSAVLIASEERPFQRPRVRTFVEQMPEYDIVLPRPRHLAPKETELYPREGFWSKFLGRSSPST